MATRPPWKRRNESVKEPQLTLTLRGEAGITVGIKSKVHSIEAGALPVGCGSVKRTPKRVATEGGSKPSPSVRLAVIVRDKKVCGVPRSASSSGAGACSSVRAMALKVMTRGSVCVDFGGTVAQPQLMRRDGPPARDGYSASLLA
eukprot:scaffold218156_cov30-Tisochrysis_lutea.AAC.3